MRLPAEEIFGQASGAGHSPTLGATADEGDAHEQHRYEPQPYEEVDDGPSLVEIHVTEAFSGDIEGDGVVRFLPAGREDGPGGMIILGERALRVACSSTTTLPKIENPRVCGGSP